MGCNLTKEIITEKVPNPNIKTITTVNTIQTEPNQNNPVKVMGKLNLLNLEDDTKLDEIETTNRQNIYKEKHKTAEKLSNLPTLNDLIPNKLSPLSKLKSKKYLTLLTLKKEVNVSALNVQKYYKDQTRPKNDHEPYTDSLFPPTIDSLFPKKRRLSSLVAGNLQGLVEKDYVNVKILKSFNFSKDDIAWYRASEIFPNKRYTIFENKIEVNDIMQGNVGNCYFMSSLAAMCVSPQLIMELFRTLSVTSNGCYEVVMRIDGVWNVILLDDYFPCHKDSKKPLFAQPNGSELWVMLLEKAWAKVNGCYFNIIGGWSSDVLFSLTSFPVFNLDHKNMDKEVLWNKLKNLSDRNNIITCTSKNDPNIEKLGLICGHSFTIIRMKEALVKNRLIKLVRVRNPWGYREWNGRWSDKSKEWTDETRSIFNYFKPVDKSEDDGEFYIEYYDYLRFFIITEVCQVSKNVCSKSITIEELNDGSVIEIIIEEESDIKIQAVKRSGRFHKILPNDAELNMNIILLKKETKEKGKLNFKYLDSNTDAIFNPFINKVLQPGVYFVYIFADYSYSNFDRKRKYLLNVSSDVEFKLTKKANDNNFLILQEIISNSVTQLCRSNVLTIDKRSEISSVLLNRFQNTSFGVLYLKNHNKDKVLTVNVTDNSTNMYLLAPKDRPKEFKIKNPPNDIFTIVGIRKQYYEEFCFNLEFLIVEEIENNLDSRLSLKNKYSEENTKLFEVLNYNPDSPIRKSNSYFDFVHSWFLIDLKSICSKINSKQHAIDLYQTKYPEEMDLVMTVPKLTDLEEVMFYDKYFDEEGYYFGEWKIKNPFTKHGRGMFIYTSGNIIKYVGQMQNNMKSGLGTIYYSNGDKIEINFIDDQMDGEGTKTFSDGKVRKIEYSKDVLIKESEYTKKKSSTI